MKINYLSSSSNRMRVEILQDDNAHHERAAPAPVSRFLGEGI